MSKSISMPINMFYSPVRVCIFCYFCCIGRTAKCGTLGGRRGVETAVQAERVQKPPSPWMVARARSGLWRAKVGAGGVATENVGESKLFQITSVCCTHAILMPPIGGSIRHRCVGDRRLRVHPYMHSTAAVHHICWLQCYRADVLR